MPHKHQRQFIATLRAQLGDPYVWGAAGPNAFDCSGLVYYAARMAGIKNVPRTSQEQFRVGTPVQMNSLRPGDLVFMNYEGVGATHVGVYVGNGQILEAPHTGDVVKTLPVSAFAGHILGARRIIANPAGHVADASRFANDQIAFHRQQTAQQRANPAIAAAAVAGLQATTRPIQLPQLPKVSPEQTLAKIQTAHALAQPNAGLEALQRQQQAAQQPAPYLASQPDYAGQLASLRRKLVGGVAP